MKLKRLIPLALAVSLLTGCGGPSGGQSPAPGPESSAPSGQITVTPSGEPSPSGQITVSPPPSGESVPPNIAPPIDLSAFALAQASYPEFPQYPEQPADDDWNAFFDAESKYYQAVRALRGDCGSALLYAHDTLLDFAARSTPLALAGHEGENAIYSPLSLWSALVLAAQCAQGESRAQLLSALHYGDAEGLAALLRQVWLMLFTDDGRDALTLANSVWLSDAAQGHYVQDTLDVLANELFSSVYSVPMGTDEADQAITAWISDQTHGLIGNSGPVVETKVITLAVLASSLYYRAGWTDEPYTLNAAEKEVLLRKMDAYCQEQTGQTLRDYSAQLMADDMAPPTQPLM